MFPKIEVLYKFQWFVILIRIIIITYNNIRSSLDYFFNCTQVNTKIFLVHDFMVYKYKQKIIFSGTRITRAEFDIMVKTQNG